MDFSLAVAFFAGIISFLSPCIIPMLGVYFSWMTGLSLSDLEKHISQKVVRRNLIRNTLSFVLAFSLVFIIAGGLSGTIGKLISRNMKVINYFGGAVILFFGFSLTGILKLKVVSPFRLRFGQPYKGTGIFHSFLVGLFFALACSHCFGALLYSILIYAGTTGSAEKGMIIMALFSLGLAIPYFLSSLALGQVMELLESNKKKMKAIQSTMGVVLIIFGLFTITNNFSVLMTFLNKFLPYKLPFGLGV